jgi:SAM-dependent methyltransferase
MDSKMPSSLRCPFCNGGLSIKFENLYHPIESGHGPFNTMLCENCGSWQVSPLPTPESLDDLYGGFIDGLPELHRKITSNDIQTGVYKKCLQRIKKITKFDQAKTFSWIDVGAGGGELSSLMADAFPNSTGVSIDLHSCPNEVLLKNPQIQWNQVNLNNRNFTDELGSYDLVISLSVWEHVLRPDQFVTSLLKLLRPMGVLYLLSPNSGSFAAKMLGKKWPYHIPGEHLSIPTPNGAIECIKREWLDIEKSGNQKSLIQIRSNSILLPYSLKYIVRRFGLELLGSAIPAGIGFGVPAGALETTVKRFD